MYSDLKYISREVTKVQCQGQTTLEALVEHWASSIRECFAYSSEINLHAPPPTSIKKLLPFMPVSPLQKRVKRSSATCVVEFWRVINPTLRGVIRRVEKTLLLLSSRRITQPSCRSDVNRYDSITDGRQMYANVTNFVRSTFRTS